MKRIVILILLAALLMTGLSFPAHSTAESDHPITLTITCDPMPEIEDEGTIPELLFTIRNTGEEEYTLCDAKLSGGFEKREMTFNEDIVIPAGGSKEFTLNDVPVAQDQLDRAIMYRLTWEEIEISFDEETGETNETRIMRDTTASITIERFVIPELTVEATCETESVRLNETFEITYTIRNDTEFDVTGLRLYDPEQSMQSIPIPHSELSSGETISVKVEYKMGMTDMSFDPHVEYIVRRREAETQAQSVLKITSVVVDLIVTTEMRPATADGTTFAIDVFNNGSHPVTDVRVYDEINTLLEEPFTLGPDEHRTVIYTVQPATSNDRVRNVKFHVTAVDWLEAPITIRDPGVYSVVPYVRPDSVQLTLSAVLQSPYYNEDGKLCASIQFIIRNGGEVKLYHAVLRETTLFGEVTSYEELRHGNTYFTQLYQLDNVTELKFRVDAVDPAGMACKSETIRLDLSGLKELADRKAEPVHVYTQNPYIQDIDTKYSGVLRLTAIIGLSVAAVCAIVCIILYAVEIRIRNKLPGEFEDEMERALNATKRRPEKQLFSDAPTEQFGYTAPIKLRNYGELTKEEAEARRALYEKGLRENLRREGLKQPAKPKPQPAPVRTEGDGTRAIPVVRRTVPEVQTPSDGTRSVPVVRKTTQAEKGSKPATAEKKPTVEPIPEEEPVRIYQPRRSRPVPEAEPDNPQDTLHALSSLAQGGHGAAPESVPDSVTERKSANMHVGGGVLDAPPETDNPPDTLHASSSLAKGGQGAAPEPMHDNPPKASHEPVVKPIYAAEAPTPIVPPIAQIVQTIRTEPEKEPDNTHDTLLKPHGIVDNVQAAEPEPTHKQASAPVSEPEKASASEDITTEAFKASIETESLPTQESYEPSPAAEKTETEPSLTPERFRSGNWKLDPAYDYAFEKTDAPKPREGVIVTVWKDSDILQTPEPDNPPDTNGVSLSLEQGGQGVALEPETEPERTLVHDFVGDVDLDVPSEPERTLANTFVGGDVLDAPPAPETEPATEPELDPEPEPATEPEIEPQPLCACVGPHRAAEKPLPKKRPVVLQPIRRIG